MKIGTKRCCMGLKAISLKIMSDLLCHGKKLNLFFPDPSLTIYNIVDLLCLTLLFALPVHVMVCSRDNRIQGSLSGWGDG
jgi:hypothetical protein